MSATCAHPLHDRPRSTRSGALWAVLGTVAGAQLFAFWLLCAHQVRKAEARHTAVVVQQMALADCLQYIPGSTIASCSGRVVTARATLPAATATAGALSVSYTR